MPAIRRRWMPLCRAQPLGVNVPQREFDSAVVFLPKSKDLTDYLLNAVASRLEGP
jgi:hypothetical protein